MDKDFVLFQVVVADISGPDEHVLQGDLGTIVEIYDSPTLAYEVEFVNPDGSTRALMTMMPNQIRHSSAGDANLGEGDLEAEERTWDEAMERHADKFAELKAQAQADIVAGNTMPMFDENGEFIVK